MDKYLRNLQKNWLDLGRRDPLWAVLTEKEKRGEKWDAEEFFQTGEREVERMLGDIQRLNHSFSQGVALDFGCGVGRITQALSRSFDEVHGIDISASMISKAKEFNRWPDKCSYRVNDDKNISDFRDNSIDFICAKIVLQHMKPRYAKEYLKEFLRIIKPGGVIAFQLPETPTTWKAWIHSVAPAWIWSIYTKIRYGHWGVMEMNGIPHKDVIRHLEANGGEVIDSRRDDLGDWTSYTYYATKDHRP